MTVHVPGSCPSNTVLLCLVSSTLGLLSEILDRLGGHFYIGGSAYCLAHAASFLIVRGSAHLHPFPSQSHARRSGTVLLTLVEHFTDDYSTAIFTAWHVTTFSCVHSLRTRSYHSHYFCVPTHYSGNILYVFCFLLFLKWITVGIISSGLIFTQNHMLPYFLLAVKFSCIHFSFHSCNGSSRL